MQILFYKIKTNMMRIIYFTFLLFSFSSLLAQQTHLEVNFGALFAGYGDQHGKYGGLKLKTEVYKDFYVAGHFAIGHAAKISSAIYQEGLRDVKNLLVLDEYTDNYPLYYFPATLDIGKKRVAPSTDFITLAIAGLGLGRDFTLKNRLVLGIEGGVNWYKLENTYVTLVANGEFESPILTNGLIPVTITVPLILSFIDYTWYLTPTVRYKINDYFSAGLFGTVYHNKGSTTSSYGLSLSTVIFNRK